MIDHYDDLFRVPSDIMNDVYITMMDIYPRQLNWLLEQVAASSGSTCSAEAVAECSSTDSVRPQIYPLTEPPLFRSMSYVTMIDKDGRNQVSFIDYPTKVTKPHQRTHFYQRHDFTHENSVGPTSECRTSEHCDNESKRYFKL